MLCHPDVASSKKKELEQRIKSLLCEYERETGDPVREIQIFRFVESPVYSLKIYTKQFRMEKSMELDEGVYLVQDVRSSIDSNICRLIQQTIEWDAMSGSWATTFTKTVDQGNYYLMRDKAVAFNHDHIDDRTARQTGVPW